MDERFDIYNTHLEHGVEHFIQHDPQLSRLEQLPYAHTFPMVGILPYQESGIYTLGGSRQIGKSTLLKQWMAHLMLERGVPAAQLYYMSGDVIDGYHQLITLITSVLAQMSEGKHYIIVDEVTYIKDWDKAVKHLADTAQLDNAVLMLSGSDLTMIEEARMRFPGRRGDADVQDFHLYPLSFYEVLCLTKADLASAINQEDGLTPALWDDLYEAFNRYLQHGGYLRALNDLARFNKIKKATFQTYSDWIRGDMLKRGKQEAFLREILSGILKHYSSQLTWNTLAKSLSIDHHKTVADYIDLLSRMEAVYVQYALIEDKLVAAPKKARKIFFSDPFVWHAIRSWLQPEAGDPYDAVMEAVHSPEEAALLVETVVVNHFRRHYETYYIKSEGEVDIAYIHQGKFWPIELKWRKQTHAKDLKQVSKYAHAEVWGKVREEGAINNLKLLPLPLALAKMG